MMLLSNQRLESDVLMHAARTQRQTATSIPIE